MVRDNGLLDISFLVLVETFLSDDYSVNVYKQHMDILKNMYCLHFSGFSVYLQHCSVLFKFLISLLSF